MTDAQTLDTQIHQVEDRLVDDYGSDHQDRVRRLVARERDRFLDARVNTFVPILVERSVRTQLGQPSHN